MKKISFLFAFVIQFSIAQNNPISGEYLSIDKSTFGINLLLNNDNTYHLAVFSGKYKVENDSIHFEKNTNESSFNLKFEKGKSATKEITIFSEPTSIFSLMDEIYIGVQEKENSVIIYKALNEYFNEDVISEHLDNIYNGEAKEEKEKLSFSVARPYALYFVKNKRTLANIEKYIIPADVNAITVEANNNIFSELEISGNINEDKTLTIFMDNKNPLKFQNKNNLPKTNAEKAASKTTEKNWTYPGKKDNYNMYGNNIMDVDSTATVEYDEYNNESDYKFAVKVETSFEEAVKKLKNKYLVIYYNPKSKNQQKEFDDIIKDYNENVSYDMNDGYNEEYDRFNFYLANAKDEKLFKANGITKFPATIIIDEKKQLLGSSKNRYTTIAGSINKYDFTEKIETAKNAIQIDEVLSAKNTDNSKLIKLLSSDTNNFYIRHLDLPNDVYVYEDENYDEAMAVVDSAATAVADQSYYEGSFSHYKMKTTQAQFNQKLKDLFASFQAKKIVDEEFIGVLLNEITLNQNSLKFFEKENSMLKEDIKKYLAYAITYNGDNSKKEKILNAVAGYLLDLEDKNDVVYEEIAKNIMLSSNYKAFQTKTYLEVTSHKSSKIEEIVYSVNQFYNNINANQALFENLNAQFENMNEIYKRSSGWNDFKNLYSSVFAVASQNILKHNETSKFNDVQKWLECANKISRNNVDVTQAMFDYYSVKGNTAKANEMKAKLEVLTKE